MIKVCMDRSEDLVITFSHILFSKRGVLVPYPIIPVDQGSRTQHRKQYAISFWPNSETLCA